MNPLARSSLLVVAVMVAGMSLGHSLSLADELPEDTNKIESLTPEQARKLAKEFPGVTVEFEIKGFGKPRVPDCLPLNGLKSLDAETARALAGYGKGPLVLSGLTTLDADTAKALAEFKGIRLDLSGLTTLDDDTAKALAGFKSDSLGFSGLTTLDADTAKALAEFKRLELDLSGLTTLDADTAKALAEFKGLRLDLSGLTTLDVCTAKALAEFRGQLHLNGLTTFDPDTFKALTELKGDLLPLNGLTTLSAETAKALAAAEKWDGRLLRINALDSPDAVAVAQALATRKGPLKLPNLKRLSPKTLTALIQKRDVEIPLIETLELIQEPDGSVTEDFIIPEGFKQRSR